LVAALGSYLHARQQQGRWLLRIEDIDPPREVAGSAQAIIAALQAFGLQAEAPPLYQSTRMRAYRDALQQLLDRGLAFPCACTRSELPAGPYPGTCRDGLPAGRQARSVRLRVDDSLIEFVDAVHGPQQENLALGSGDFVIWRADDLPAYQLAVVVDDAWQNVTEVVRGMDLLESTARQIHLQRALQLPRPAYAHLPLAIGSDGNKLSKRLGADPLNLESPRQVLLAALRFLGQPARPAGSVQLLLEQAIADWQLQRVPTVAAAVSWDTR
jgi:glutamyl-Q tRNA(Asp) synthetase